MKKEGNVFVENILKRTVSLKPVAVDSKTAVVASFRLDSELAPLMINFHRPFKSLAGKVHTHRHWAGSEPSTVEVRPVQYLATTGAYSMSCRPAGSNRRAT